MQRAEIDAFIDTLYAATVEPDMWAPAMTQMADLIGGSGAWLSRVSAVDGSGSGIITRIDPAMPQRYAEYYGFRNPFAIRRDPHRYIRQWQPRIRFLDDFVTRDDMAHNEYFNDFLRPQKIDQCMMIGLAADGVETCVLNINTSQRGFEPAQIALARRLHSHLRRAFNVSRTFAGSAPGHLLDVLDRNDQAVFLVDAAGRVRHANDKAAQLAAEGTGLRLVDGRLAPINRAAGARLARLIGTATARETASPGERGGSVALPRLGRRPLAANVTPLRQGPHNVFTATPLAMVSISDPDAAAQVSSERLRTLYGLTPAETRLAVALLDGSSPREVADALGVRFQTVRNQLQQLYEKTHTSRQSALVLLLANTGR